MHIGVAAVVDEDADQETVRPAVGDVESQIATHRRETARLYDIGEDVGAHLRAPVAQFTQRARRDIGGNCGDQERNDQRRGKERPQQPPRRHAGRIHHDDLRIGSKLVEDVRRRHDQRDRRQHHDQKRDDHAGDADEDQHGLALTGDQVEVAHRLREPDHDGQADEDDQERAHRGAKHIAADRPHRTELPQ